jgi:hypothetical protein
MRNVVRSFQDVQSSFLPREAVFQEENTVQATPKGPNVDTIVQFIGELEVDHLWSAIL